MGGSHSLLCCAELWRFLFRNLPSQGFGGVKRLPKGTVLVLVEVGRLMGEAIIHGDESCGE